MDFECEETIFYSDNKACLAEVRFSVPGELWSEFEKSPAYQGLKAHLDSLRTQYTQRQPRVSECKIRIGADTTEIMNTDQPNTITVNGVEIPSYYYLWRRLSALEEKIVWLKIAVILELVIFVIVQIFAFC